MFYSLLAIITFGHKSLLFPPLYNVWKQVVKKIHKVYITQKVNMPLVNQSIFAIEGIINFQKSGANCLTHYNPESHISGSNSEQSAVHMKYFLSSKNLHMWT